jgi:hypothetical protein
MPKFAGFQKPSTPKRFTADANIMAVASTESCEPKTHLREGAIYRDSSNNIIRLLSIRGDYCVYIYLALGNPRSEMHGSVTGLTRRNVFEAGFILVAECAEDWNVRQRKISNERVQAFHLPSSPGSIAVALVPEPQKRLHNVATVSAKD